MRLTQIGTDYITIDEDNINDQNLLNIPRVHLIHLCFFNPTKDKIMRVVRNYPKTNRYVIGDNIRTYNYVFKNTSKKYYVMNQPDTGIISFFRRNNKVLMNFQNLNVFEQQFILGVAFEDVLRNLEVIMIDKDSFEEKKEVLEKWNGNVIVQGN